MVKLIRTLPNGRNKLFSKKLILSLFGTVFVYLACYVPQLLYLHKTYGFSNLLAPLRSLSAMSDSMFGNLSLLGYIILIYTIRLMMAVFVLYVIIILSLYFRHTIPAASLTGVLLALQLFVHILGIRMFDYCSLNALFSVNLMFQEWNKYVTIPILFLPGIGIVLFHLTAKKISARQ